MGIENLARASGLSEQKGAGATGIACTGGLHVQQPDDGTIHDLKRADQFIPFSPETFLDELVQLFAVTDAGAGVEPSQFRAMPPDVRASVAEAFLQHFAGADPEAALPRMAGEGDAAYLLRFWRTAKLQPGAARAPIARRADAENIADSAAAEPEQSPSDESKISAGSLGQMDLTTLRLVPLPLREPPTALSSDIPSLNVSPNQAMAPELAAAPEPIGGPINKVMIADADAPRGNGAMVVALMAVILALAGIGVSALLFERQDSANQRMMATMRQQQDALEQSNRANRLTIDQLNETLRHSTAERTAPVPDAAPVPTAAPAVASPAPSLRSASTSGTPRPVPHNAARAAHENGSAKDDETLAAVLDNAAGAGGDALPPTAGGQYVDPRYGDPHYAGPQYPVRRGDVAPTGNGY